ncbi:MAG TPA: chemotaxis protein CheW [Planctomycetaceae bacterium]|jgi:purine-binding chemotaxis protein CheW|nr:chemotaxis protein CheW [Planctomycetaceae bacterium]
MIATRDAVRSDSGSEMGNQLDYHNQYVSFYVRDQLLGVPVNAVQEVLNPQSIARVPKAKPEIAGLLNLRGQIVTAIDLRKRLGLPELGEGRQSINVVISHQGEPYSLLVDEVGDVINVSGDALQPSPQTLDAQWKRLVAGVFRLEKRLFVILNVATLLSF